MKRLLVFVLPVGLVALIACRGSVERDYGEALSTLADGGIDKSKVDGAAGALAPAHIRGDVLGLVGTGLVLQDNGGDSLAINAGGAFTFDTLVPPGAPYAVTVATQPIGPTQTCTVENGAGTAQGVDVTDVHITCNVQNYPIGGTVIGLTSGDLVLQNNGGNDITVPTGATSFSFANGVPSGANFNVTVKSGPPGSNCNVSGGTGTVVTANVDTVVINCAANSYTIGGTVSGLAGTLVVQNAGANDRTIAANGSFAFSVPVANGKPYSVTIKQNPTSPVQTCTIANGSGTVNAANVTSVAITCTTTKFTVGGTVSGLTTSGLILQNKGTDDKAIPANTGPFTFATALTSGTSYTVSIKSQPAGQTCTLQNPAGSITNFNVTNVGLTCSAPLALEEHFDKVTAPALPSGWTTIGVTGAATSAEASLGVRNVWATSTTQKQSAPNGAHINEPGSSTDAALVSPSFQVSSATAKLSFWQWFITEEQWDGGILEISIAGGPWVEFIKSGGAFTANGYNTFLQTDGTSDLGGYKAWSGQGTYVTTGTLPATAAGKSVQLRWRFATDDGADGSGWYIDDVVVSN